MYYFNSYYKPKTKEDYILDLIELEAYYNLDSQVFNFGTEDIINDGEYNMGVGYVYLKMNMELLHDIINYWDDTDFNTQYNPSKKHKKKKRLNRYERKKDN
jgi:hypothetical protein